MTPWSSNPGRTIHLNRSASAVTPVRAASTTALGVLLAISFCHLLNDLMQSLLPALYPMLKSSYRLSFTQIGLLTFTFQFTASLLQPVIGAYADKKPRPYSLAAGMGCTLVGLLLLAFAANYALLLLAAALIGTGSSVFHPESSRVARMASGGRHGYAQSIFQVGGNIGSSTGPLLAAFIVLPHGQTSVAWFSAVALLGIVVLFNVGHWYKAHGLQRLAPAAGVRSGTPGARVALGMSVLLALLFSKYFYLASITSYYTFYLIDHFHLSVRAAQLHLFVFLAAVAAGGFLGGPLGDRLGTQVRDLGLDPRGPALHAAAAAREPVLDQRAHRADRADPRLGLPGDRGVRAGPDARAHRHGCRTGVRARLRHGQHRGRGPGHAGRPHRHRCGLPDMRLPAAHRPARRLAARGAQAPGARYGLISSGDEASV